MREKSRSAATAIHTQNKKKEAEIKVNRKRPFDVQISYVDIILFRLDEKSLYFVRNLSRFLKRFAF